MLPIQIVWTSHESFSVQRPTQCARPTCLHFRCALIEVDEHIGHEYAVQRRWAAMSTSGALIPASNQCTTSASVHWKPAAAVAVACQHEPNWPFLSDRDQSPRHNAASQQCQHCSSLTGACRRAAAAPGAPCRRGQKPPAATAHPHPVSKMGTRFISGAFWRPSHC